MNILSGKLLEKKKLQVCIVLDNPPSALITRSVIQNTWSTTTGYINRYCIEVLHHFLSAGVHGPFTDLIYSSPDMKCYFIFEAYVTR